MKKIVNVIGGGFAGMEAALTLADFGVEVHLFDDHCPLEGLTYKKQISQTFLNELFAMGCQSELSNNLASLRQKTLQKVEINEKIKVFNEKIDEISLSEPTIIATGNNTSEQLFSQISQLVGGYNCKKFSFSPLILQGQIECEQDEKFAYLAVSESKLNDVYNFLKEFPSDGECVENWAASGKQLLKAKAFKPVFVNRKIIQNCLKFRKEDDKNILQNFPTFLNSEQQEKLFFEILDIKNCSILQFASAQFCTRILPVCVNNFFRSIRNENIYFAGSILGIDGELEAIATAHLAAINLISQIFDLKSVAFPDDTLSKNLCDLFASDANSSSKMIGVCDIIKSINEKQSLSRLSKFKEDINARISRHNYLCGQKRW